MEKIMKYLKNGCFISTNDNKIYMFLDGLFLNKDGELKDYQDIGLVNYISHIAPGFIVSGAKSWDLKLIAEYAVYARKNVKVIDLYSYGKD